MIKVQKWDEATQTWIDDEAAKWTYEQPSKEHPLGVAVFSDGRRVPLKQVTFS